MPQRRYTDKELAILSSGETPAPTDDYWSQSVKDYLPSSVYKPLENSEWFYRNLYSGIVGSVPQLAEVPNVVASAGGALSDIGSEKGFGGGFMSRYYGGDDNLTKMQQYIADQKAAYLAELPPEEQNDPGVQAAAEGAVRASKGFYDLQQQILANSGTLGNWASYGIAGENNVNDFFGVNPTYRQSQGEELTQILGSALIPTPKVGVALKAIPLVERLAAKTPAAVRMAVKAPLAVGETMLPGSSGPVNAAFNVAVPGALNTTMRSAQGMPLVGDPAATDIHIGSTPTTDRLPQEAPQDQPPFTVAQQTPVQQVSPGASVDTDPEKGGSGWSWATIAGYTGAAALALSALRTRVPSGIATQIIQDVDSPNAALRMQPTPTDAANLQPGLTTGQKVKAGIQKTQAIEDTARNALANDPEIETKVRDINRDNAAASRLEVSNAFSRTALNGEVPYLDRRTVPLRQLRQMRDQSFQPDDHAKLQDYVTYVDRQDRYNLETDSIVDQVTDLNNKLLQTTGPAARTAVLDRISALETQIRDRLDPNARITDRSASEISRLRAEVDANPRIQMFLTNLKRVRDDFYEAGVRAGMYTQDYVDRMKTQRPNHMPVSLDPYAGLTETQKFGKRLKKGFSGRAEPTDVADTEGGLSTKMYGGKRGPLYTKKEAEIAPSSQLKDVVDAMDERVYEFHRQLRGHQAAQTFTETMAGTPDWGRTVRQAHEPISIQDWEKNTPDIMELKRDPLVYVYNKNGMMHVMKAADSETARALRFNPSSTIGIFDQMRRWNQMTFTGPLAPWFAPVAAEAELWVARARLDPKYSKGILDRWLKDTFPNSAIARTFDYVPDPSVKLMQLGAIFEQVGAKALKNTSIAMGSRMERASTLLQQTHLGPRVAEAGIRTVNDLRGRYQFMETHVTTNMHDIVEHNESAFRNLKAVQQIANTKGGRVVGKLVEGYVGLLDAVRNSTKYAIASQNLERLIVKYDGYDNIPKKVLNEFTHDMRYMSGDMTKAIGNKYLASAASVVPYGQNWINSTAHLLETKPGSYVPYATTRIITNMILPKIAAVYLLTQMFTKPDGSNEFIDDYWDNLPLWQRQSTIPVLKPEYFLDMVSGGPRKPTLDDITYMRQAPEGTLFAETVMSMLQATGIFGLHAKDTASWSDFGNAIESFFPARIPIWEAAQIATTGGTESSKYQGPGMSGDSAMTAMWKDALGAMFGASTEMVFAGMEASSNSLWRGQGIVNAIESAFSYPAQKLAQKLQPTTVGTLFGGQRRHYTKGQTRERNLSYFNAIKEIDDQISEQNFDQTGPSQYRLPMVSDPMAMDMMKEMHTAANSGPMNALRKARSQKSRMIERLDQNRGQIAASEHTRMTEYLKQEIQKLDRQEEKIFNDLTQRLQRGFGQAGINSIEDAVKYVRSQLHP